MQMDLNRLEEWAAETSGNLARTMPHASPGKEEPFAINPSRRTAVQNWPQGCQQAAW